MSKDRKQIILQSLAKLLEERDATKVTTAVLASESGITEAALYRHFPSKRSIFLELFTFCDQTVFQKVGEIKKDNNIEAKEKVAIQRETQTVATITIQNYFRMYEKLAGMTGTAKTEAAEFMEIYKLDVIEIPTNQPISRKDHEDLIYKTNEIELHIKKNLNNSLNLITDFILEQCSTKSNN